MQGGMTALRVAIQDFGLTDCGLSSTWPTAAVDGLVSVSCDFPEGFPQLTG
jgi:hypothetical protein